MFFRALDAEAQQRFRRELQVFLGEKRVTGVKVQLDATTLVLAAASVAVLATLAEALGRSGWDTLWIGLAALVALVWWEGGPDATVGWGALAAASGSFEAT